MLVLDLIEDLEGLLSQGLDDPSALKLFHALQEYKEANNLKNE